MKGPVRPQGMGTQGAPPESEAERERRYHEAKRSRDRQLVVGALGIGMMFLGGLFWPVAVGGALLVLSAIAQYLRWSRRMQAAYDPWSDPELDAWEDEHFGERS